MVRSLLVAVAVFAASPAFSVPPPAITVSNTYADTVNGVDVIVIEGNAVLPAPTPNMTGLWYMEATFTFDDPANGFSFGDYSIEYNHTVGGNYTWRVVGHSPHQSGSLPSGTYNIALSTMVSDQCWATGSSVFTKP